MSRLRVLRFRKSASVRAIGRCLRCCAVRRGYRTTSLHLGQVNDPSSFSTGTIHFPRQVRDGQGIAAAPDSVLHTGHSTGKSSKPNSVDDEMPSTFFVLADRVEVGCGGGGAGTRRKRRHEEAQSAGDGPRADEPDRPENQEPHRPGLPEEDRFAAYGSDPVGCLLLPDGQVRADEHEPLGQVSSVLLSQDRSS